jgi:hypothetical protein
MSDELADHLTVCLIDDRARQSDLVSVRLDMASIRQREQVKSRRCDRLEDLEEGVLSLPTIQSNRTELGDTGSQLGTHIADPSLPPPGDRVETALKWIAQ